MKRLMLMLGFCLLSACASRPPLPAQLPELVLPMQLHIQRQQAAVRQDWMLVIQREDTHLRWTLLDLLGIPQARQVLDHGQWRADGLLPPNPAARELFAALLFALSPEEHLQTLYPQARQQGQQRWLNERWQIAYRQAGHFTVTLDQGLRYQVSPLPSENTP